MRVEIIERIVQTKDKIARWRSWPTEAQPDVKQIRATHCLQHVRGVGEQSVASVFSQYCLQIGYDQSQDAAWLKDPEALCDKPIGLREVKMFKDMGPIDCT
jgi:hypothetical protein